MNPYLLALVALLAFAAGCVLTSIRHELTDRRARGETLDFSGFRFGQGE